MQWTYEDPSTIPKDEIRLLIGDVDSGYPLLYDEEIQFFLKKDADDVQLAAYHCAKSILHRIAYEPNYTIGPESVSGTGRLQTLQKLVKDLNPATDAGAPKLAVNGNPPHPGTHDTFHVGMMDNGWDEGCMGIDHYGRSLS